MYKPTMTLKETQVAIKLVKVFFEHELSERLNLTRVSAPLFVEKGTGINDDLNGIERPVAFDILDSGKEVEIVQSLAKWKRKALKDYELVLEIDPNLTQAKYNIGVIQLATESFAAAAKTFEELKPENLDQPIDFYFYQAESLYFAGEKEEACKLYKKAKDLGDTESSEIYEKYCVNNEERLESGGKTRTIRATF